MPDRQKVELILRRQFPAATWDEIAVAANGIMGLDDEWQEVDLPDRLWLTAGGKSGTDVRLFRRAGPVGSDPVLARGQLPMNRPADARRPKRRV